MKPLPNLQNPSPGYDALHQRLSSVAVELNDIFMELNARKLRPAAKNCSAARCWARAMIRAYANDTELPAADPAPSN